MVPDPASEPLTTVEVTGRATGPKTTDVETPTARFTVGTDASPVEHLLGALAGCVTVVGHLVADERGIEIDGLATHVEGDLDPRTYRGETTGSDDPRAGFQSIRVTVTVDSDADWATLVEWLDTVLDRCPVSDNVGDGTPIDAGVERA
jgi:uncharacterized OsmC-like protein